MICGAAVGAVVALLLSPASGKELRDELLKHWQTVLDEAKKAQEETRQQLENEFNNMTKS